MQTYHQWKQAAAPSWLDYYGSAVRDNAKAFGKGLWNGANAVVQGTGALNQGIGNVATNTVTAPWRVLSKLTGVNTTGVQNALTFPMRAQNTMTQAVQDKVNDWNKTVQSTYQNENPNSFGVRWNHAVGTVVPIALSAYYGAKIPGASRLAAPVKAKDVAALAANTVGRVPAVGKYLATPTKWMASGSNLANAYNVATNTAAWGLPASDYALGLTRQQEGDSKVLRTGKQLLSYAPAVASAVNPAAGINALINRSNARVEPAVEALANTATNVAPTYVDASRGAILPYAEKAFEALKSKDIDYDRVLRYSDKLMNTGSIGEAFDMTRDEVKDTRNNAQLRWLGLQPTSGNKVVDKLLGRDPNGIVEAVIRGYNKAVQDNPELVQKIMGSDLMKRFEATREQAKRTGNVAQNVQKDLLSGNYEGIHNRLRNDLPPVIQNAYGPEATRFYNNVLQGAEKGTSTYWSMMTPEQQEAARKQYATLAGNVAAGEQTLVNTLEGLQSGTIGAVDGWRNLQQAYRDVRDPAVDFYMSSSPLAQDVMQYLWRQVKQKADDWWKTYRGQM